MRTIVVVTSETGEAALRLMHLWPHKVILLIPDKGVRDIPEAWNVRYYDATTFPYQMARILMDEDVSEIIPYRLSTNLQEVVDTAALGHRDGDVCINIDRSVTPECAYQIGTIMIYCSSIAIDYASCSSGAEREQDVITEATRNYLYNHDSLNS